jgi:predicted metal-dependent phosphotriesterase family hydrolase
VERIIITHVDFPSTFYTIEEQKELLKSGAFVEHCYTTPATGKVAWEVAIEQIRAIGAKRVVLATDLGQTAGVFPDEGLALYGEKLLANGFSEDDVRTMIVKNPASLIE